MPVVSLTGRLRASSCALGRHEVAAWWWCALRQQCPRVAATVVIPDAFWLVAHVADPGALFGAVTERAAALGDRLGACRPVWRPIASPLVASSAAQARRWVRAALQWPRALGLCSDPVGWRWSTARDLAGAVCDPWVDLPGVEIALGEEPPGSSSKLERSAEALWSDHRRRLDPQMDRRSDRRLDRRLDRQLSRRVGWRDGPAEAQRCGDRRHWHGVGPPSVLPSLGSPSVPRAALPLLAEAAAEATRTRPDAIGNPGATRNVFLWLARAHGWAHPALSEATGAALPRVLAILAEPNPRWLDAARRCLVDPRIGRLGVAASPGSGAAQGGCESGCYSG